MFEEQKEIIREFYEYFNSKLTGNPRFDFKLRQNEITIIDNFFKLLIKQGYIIDSFGKEFWFNFISFQFEYWRTKNTFLGKNKIYFQWIIGEGAWNRFLTRNVDYIYFCEVGFNKFFNIIKEDLIPTKNEKQQYKFNFGEEIKSFFNEEEKLGGCYLYSNLYNRDNKECESCKEKINCLKIKKNVQYRRV